MKFEIQVGDDRGGIWWEKYDKQECLDEATIKAWAIQTIKEFNETLRPAERPRKLLGGIKIIGEGSREHKFTKRNLITQSDHRGAFDLIYCKVCGATARRYGMASIKMQKPYTAKKWLNCPGKQS